MRKLMKLLIVPALILSVVKQWPDIKRYLKIKQLSKGHPENVPIEGSIAYPQVAGKGDADGTGDFDSARRGGPKAAAGHSAPGQGRR